jgi:hypothetical protein
MEKKIKIVEDTLKKVLEDNKLEMKTMIDFPKYRELPISVKLALEILNQEGAVLIRKYSEKK